MRPRLRSILIIINVVVLLLPFLGIGALRIYDSELIRQTEASLISQGAFVQALYRESLVKEIGKPADDYGKPFPNHEQLEVDGMTPIYPEIELAESKIYPPAPKARKAQTPIDESTKHAGARIVDILKNAQKISLSGIRVVDPDGIVVASTRGEMGEFLGHREEISGALDGRVMRVLRQRISDSPDPSLDSISRRTKVRVFVGIPIVQNQRVVGAVILSRTPLSLQKALYQNRFLFIGFFIFIILVALSISLLTAVTIQRPMTRLINQMRLIAKGEKVNPLTKPRTREVDELSTALVEMANKVEHRSAYITNFSRTVSHEFKTPIASIRGSVELLKDHFEEMSDEERTEFLTLIDGESLRIQEQLSGLLALAKADMGTLENQTLDLEDACSNALANMELEGIEIIENYEKVPPVNLPKEILETLLRNLIENALHAGSSTIRLRTLPCGESVCLEVEDDGNGISEADRVNIFTPFFTTKRDEGGTGLGLAIIASMLSNIGASISVKKSDEKGTTFELLFRPSS